MLLSFLVACKPGTMIDASSGKCIDCPKGTYSEPFDATSCTPCPEGQTSFGERARYAVACFFRKYIY